MSNTTQTTVRKWSSAAGPRQTKQVEEAMKALTWKGKAITKITDFGRSTATPMFGPTSPAATAAHAAIAERFDYSITRANYAEIVAAFEQATKELVIPEIDKRSTPEELERRRIENEERQRSEAEKAANKARDKAAAVAKLRAEYPNAIAGDASKNCKAELRAKFPGVKFSVRAEYFSGGSSMNISWSMGPTTKEVDAIVGKYKAGSFDGSTDYYDYDHSAESEAVKEVLGQHKYVSTSRDYDAGVMNTVAKGLAAIVGDELPERWHRVPADKLMGRDDYSTAVYQILSHTQFPPGAIVSGVELEADEEKHTHEWYSRYRVVYGVMEGTTSAAADGSDEPAAGGYAIQKHWHDKRRFDFWLIVPAVRMSAEAFDAKRASCEAAGGWYSRKWGKTPGGFAFKSEQAAKEWATAAFGSES